MRFIEKPRPGEYPPYADMYMKFVPDDGLLLQHLWDNFTAAREVLLTQPEEKLLFKYREDKWTIKEILVHIIDDERIYAYRVMSFARNEKAPLPGFVQDDYAFYSDANIRSIENIFEEYEAVSKSTIALFNGLPEEALLRSGVAND